MPRAERGFAHVAPDDAIHASVVSRPPRRLTKQRMTARPRRDDGRRTRRRRWRRGASRGDRASGNIARMASAAARLNGTSRSFPPLPRHPHHPADEVDILRDPDRRVRSAADRTRRTAPGSRDPAGRRRWSDRARRGSRFISSTEMRRQRLLAARRPDERGRILRQHFLSHEVPGERPKGRQPPRGRSAADAAIVEGPRKPRTAPCRMRATGTRSAVVLSRRGRRTEKW